MLGARMIQAAAGRDSGGGGTQSYADLVLGDGPVAYWRLDETSGSTAADETGNGRDGSYVNGPTLNSEAAVSDGTSVHVNDNGHEAERVNLGNPDNWGVSSAITIELWVKWVGGSSTNWPAPIGKGRDDGYSIYWSYTSDLNWLINNVGTVSISFDFSNYDWVHLVCTYDGSSMILYVNGVAEASTSASGSIPQNGQNLIFGRDPQRTFDGDEWQGLGDEIALYDRALTATEIEEHYNKGIGA